MNKVEKEKFDKEWTDLMQLDKSSKQFNDELWRQVLACSKHTVLKYYNSKGIHYGEDYTNDLIMDIAIKSIEDMKRSYYPKSLPTFVHYRLLHVLLDKKRVWYETKVTLSDDQKLLDKGAYNDLSD